MFAKNRDYKLELEAKEEEIEALKHEHGMTIAAMGRSHDTTLLAHLANINELEDKYNVLENLHESHGDLKKRELELDDQRNDFDAAENRLATEQAEFEAYKRRAEKDLETQQEEVTNRLAKAQSKLDDTKETNYKDGHSDGYEEGYKIAIDHLNSASNRTHSLLTLHALTPTQQIVVDGEKEDSESSKILADAFAKHLTKTVDKLLEDDDDQE